MKKLRSSRGAALIVAMITMMVITTVSLTISLLVTKNAGNSLKYFKKEQARALAVSLCKTVSEEIESNPDGELGSFLKEQIGEDWTWYQEGDSFHGDLDLVSKEFKISDQSEWKLGERPINAWIKIYWTSEEQAETIGNFGARSLVVTTFLEYGKKADLEVASAATTLKMIYEESTGSYWWKATGVIR